MAISSSEVSAPQGRPRGESKVNSVDRALVILEYLGTQTKEVGVRELGQAIGLSKSSVHRILQTLRARGFVKWNPDNARYSLGMKAFEVGCGILRSMEAHAVAKPYLEQLVATLGETAFLGVLDDAELVFIDKIDGRRSVRLYADIGSRRPLHSTGIGKALLAHLDRSEIDRIIAARPLTAYTKNTITDPDALRAELEKIRRQGYAEDNEEMEDGLYCVGAPLFNYSGRPVAAISVSVPKMGQQPVQKDRLIKAVVQAAQEISAKLGYSGRPKAASLG
ncbi:MAG: IclR family transcriptional regulator [Candidatus Eremiobacteraeota bacterium]|nr:IclR family transcriptional regulator [Candidatus Eremiobacteraeota bacterium]MBV8459888.1 IclR family transcriptional regulator [Candidatus Eremiobacteraeota bacterium]MBV8671504.1 IclR family transcriptional regulator [Candidatus Eremiobacteraeota bacterium]